MGESTPIHLLASITWRIDNTPYDVCFEEGGEYMKWSLRHDRQIAAILDPPSLISEFPLKIRN